MLWGGGRGGWLDRRIRGAAPVLRLIQRLVVAWCGAPWGRRLGAVISMQVVEVVGQRVPAFLGFLLQASLILFHAFF